MSRSINKKCAACALLNITEAREKSCWVEDQCKHRRNHYRTRERKLQSQKQQYARKSGKVLPTQIEIVPDTYRSEYRRFSC
jgi:hypothetical protein